MPPVMRLVVLIRRPYRRPGKPDASLLGPCEQAALAAALRLRDALGGALTAVALGPAAHEEPVLAAALGAGCDRAVRVHAPECEGLDYLGTAEVLRAAVAELGCDLLVCGDRSQNQGHGALGPAMAELLDMPHLTGVTDVEVTGVEVAAAAASPRDGRAIVARQRNRGRIHRFRCTPPVVLCMLGPAPDALPDPPPDAPPDKHIDQLSLDDLGLDPRTIGHRGRLLGQTRATRRRRRTVMVESPAELVTRLVADRVLR